MTLQSVQTQNAFQFHTGSIKSWNTFHTQYRFECFNSILVRLKDTIMPNLMRGIGSFNSILVRLKVNSYLEVEALMHSFQFHTGSIKRCADSAYAYTASRFQFHTGSIKSVLADPPTKPNNQFQFHTGSIKSIKTFL